jgi:hypothetical protein
MAIGYNRLNSSAARSKIKAGRPAADGPNEKHEMPEWMTRNALFRPGERVVSLTFGDGVVVDYALTTVTPAKVRFDSHGEKIVVVESIRKI